MIKIMNTQLPFVANLKAIVILLLFSSLAFSCKNNEKDKPPTEQDIRIAKEKEEELAFSKYAEEIRSKHDAIFLDSLFNQDNSALTFSYILERKITKTQQPILARAIIFDIRKLADSSYLLMTAIPFKKQKTIGYLTAELKCSEQLIRKIENLNTNIANEESSYLFLVARFDKYSPVDLQFKDVSEYILARKAYGICLDIEFNPNFQKLLEFNTYD